MRPKAKLRYHLIYLQTRRGLHVHADGCRPNRSPRRASVSYALCESQASAVRETSESGFVVPDYWIWCCGPRLVDLMLCSQTSGSGAMVQAVPGASRPVRYDAQPGSPGGSARLVLSLFPGCRSRPRRFHRLTRLAVAPVEPKGHRGWGLHPLRQINTDVTNLLYCNISYGPLYPPTPPFRLICIVNHHACRLIVYETLTVHR